MMKKVRRYLSVLFTILAISTCYCQTSNEEATDLYEQILATRNPHIVLSLLDSININAVRQDSLRAYLYYYRASAYGQLAKFDSANHYMGKAHSEITKGTYPEIDIQILRAFGNINWAKNFYNIALTNYQDALAISQDINHSEFMVSLLGNIAGVYANLDNYEVALDYALQSEEVSKRTGIVRPRSHMKIGLYQIALGKPSEAVKSLEKTIDLIKVDNKDSIALGVCYNHFARAHIDLKNLREARKNLESSQIILDKLNYPLPELFSNWSKLETLLGNDERSREKIIIAIDLAKKTQDLKSLRDAKVLLKEITVRQNRLAEAVRIQDEVYSLNDSLKSKETLNKVYELEAIFELTKKEAEIDRLSLETELQKAEIKNSNLLLIGILTVSVMVIGFLILYFVQRSKKQKVEHEAQELQIEALKKRLTDLNIVPGKEMLNLDDLNRILHTPLTEREFETLQLSMEGKTNTEISEQLFIATSTVKFHLRNTYSKLRVSNRKEALEYVVKSS